MKKSTIKRAAALAVAGMMTATALAGCGGSSSSGSSKDDSSAAGNAKNGKVYYLNFKPEQDKDWQALAKKYTDETGVEVTVKTAAEGTYESTLTAEMDKDNAPTLFQVNGPVGLANWKDYCADLSSSEIYNQLTSKDYALEEDGKVYGIAYVIETYGIIYNKTLLQKYCDSDFASVKKIEDINSFEKLKTVADEIQKNKDKLGVKGAFTSAGMDSSSDWRFKTHLANLPIYFEYKDKGIKSTDAIEGKYLDNYKNIWDLYITDSTCDPADLASKKGTDAETEFTSGEAVFFQNGSWEYSIVTKAGMKDDELGMLPIYIGAGDEANQGLCTGSENYWCVNKQASEEDIQATLDFLSWVINSDEGRDSMAHAMGFTTPFLTFTGDYVADNVFIQDANQYIADGKTPVSWNFSTIPSETWKDGVGSALLEYAQGTGDWDAVVSAFVDGWASEYAAANGQ